MVLLCCEATAVLPQTHRQCWAVKVWEEGGGREHQSLVTQRVERWWHVGRRERKGKKTACILVTFHSHTLDIPSVGAVSRSGNIVISFFVLERLRCQ